MLRATPIANGINIHSGNVIPMPAVMAPPANAVRGVLNPIGKVRARCPSTSLVIADTET